MSNRQEVERIVKAARDQGFGVTRTTRGHYLFRDQEGNFICDLSGTPSSSREITNKLARLRRAGLQYGRR